MRHRPDEDEFDDDEEEGEGYLASYSDLVTDLMAVFVLLLSFALVTQATANRSSSPDLMMESTGSGLMEAGRMIEYTEYYNQDEAKGTNEGSADEGNTEYDEKGQPREKTAMDVKTEELIKELEAQIADAGLDGQVRVTKMEQNKIVMRMMDSVLFDTGKSVIKEEVKPILDGISDILFEYNSVIKTIHIEGHTDDRPINTLQFPSNWELSTGRAGSVVRFLIEKSGIAGEKFFSSGYGEFRPIASNATEEGRAVNRRVEFTIEVND